MYHAACKVEFQPFTVVLTADVFQLFIKKKNIVRTHNNTIKLQHTAAVGESARTPHRPTPTRGCKTCGL